MVVAGDAVTFLEIHSAAVRASAAQVYPAEVISLWAPLEITDARLARFSENPHDEVRVIAEFKGQAAGVGAIIPSKGELCACYVAPQFGRRGVGRSIVIELERLAQIEGLEALTLDATLNAEAFYKACGYDVLARRTHRLRSGLEIACVAMSKRLT